MAESDPTRALAETALLVIDVQDSFAQLPYWPLRNNPDFESNVARLIRTFRDADCPVIFVLHSEPDGPFAKDGPHYKLMNFIERRAGEPLVHKTTRNCFTSTDLLPILLRAGVRRIVIAGIQTEQCCETTARVGSDLGFAIDFVTEATLTFPIPESDAPGAAVLSAADIVERTQYVLRRRFARIVSVAEIGEQSPVAAAG
jgi:nicotinamidase-related amidase